MPSKPNAICKQCGQAFYTRPAKLKTGQRCCSMKCKYEWMRKTDKPNTSCDHCGKPMYAFPYRIAKGPVYCSRECTAFAFRKDQVEFNAECDECGKRFYRSPALLHKCETNYCSVKCQCAARIGERNPGWKGGCITPAGYRVIGRNGKHKAEHRIVIETNLGRELHTDEVVHHIDGNKLNNAIENLRLMSNAEHTREHKTTHGLYTVPEIALTALEV